MQGKSLEIQTVAEVYKERVTIISLEIFPQAGTVIIHTPVIQILKIMLIYKLR